MTDYRINTRNSYGLESLGFKGSAEEAIKQVQKMGIDGRQDTVWWIEEADGTHIDINGYIEEKSVGWSIFQEITNFSNHEKREVVYHPAINDLKPLLVEPSFKYTRVFSEVNSLDKFGEGIEYYSNNEGNNKYEFHHIDFDFYSNDILCGRGRNWASSEQNGVTKSVSSVLNMIHLLMSIDGIDISRVVRTDSYSSHNTSEFVKKNPLIIDIYNFNPEPLFYSEVKSTYKDNVKKRKKEFDSICDDLRNNGKTMEYFAGWERD